MNVGIVGSYILGLWFPSATPQSEAEVDGLFWRAVLTLPIITCALRIVALAYVYQFETPQYYISQQMHVQAKSVLRYIYNCEAVS